MRGWWGKRTVSRVLPKKSFFSALPFPPISVVYQNIPQKRAKLSFFKTGKREKKVDMLILNMVCTESPSPKKE